MSDLLCAVPAEVRNIGFMYTRIVTSAPVVTKLCSVELRYCADKFLEN
jgi:hypothetical protein